MEKQVRIEAARVVKEQNLRSTVSFMQSKPFPGQSVIRDNHLIFNAIQVTEEESKLQNYCVSGSSSQAISIGLAVIAPSRFSDWCAPRCRRIPIR